MRHRPPGWVLQTVLVGCALAPLNYRYAVTYRDFSPETYAILTVAGVAVSVAAGLVCDLRATIAGPLWPVVALVAWASVATPVPWHDTWFVAVTQVSVVEAGIAVAVGGLRRRSGRGARTRR